MATINDLDLAEFSELCRLCGAKTSVLLGLHIFEREGELRQIYKKITSCLPIQVNTLDKLPKMICEECAYKLDLLFDFREKSIKTECDLKVMLKELEYTPVVEPITIAVPVSSAVLNNAVIVDCVNNHIGQTVEIPVASLAMINDEVSTPPTGVLSNTKTVNDTIIRQHESIKCEPEILIKVEENQIANSNALVNNANNGESESDSDSESDSASESDDSSVNDNEGIDNNSMGEVLEPSVDHNGEDQSHLIANGGGKTSTITLNNEAYQMLPTYSNEDPHNAWFFCSLCSKTFETSEQVQMHYEVHWNKCMLCGTVFTNEEALAAHRKEMHPRKGKTSPKVKNEEEEDEKDKAKKRNDAKKKVNPSDMKACGECGKEYCTNYKLAEHMRKHTGEKPYKCSTCDKAFRSKIGLAQHEAKHTGQYDYTCNSCGKGFQCKSYLIVHQRVHSDLKPYPCTTCGRNFKTKQSLLDHQNRHLGVKPYLCETCGRGFITKGLCKSHQRVHSGTDNRQYPCTVCHKLFVSKSYLVTHLRIHTGEKPFMCEVCGKGFLTRVDLRIHSTMHTGEKSFVCETCGKAFARRDALRCHRRSHTGERPYRCDICGQSFTQFSPMAIHKRLHTGERPYACDICGKSFVSRSTMMSHRKKHTN